MLIVGTPYGTPMLGTYVFRARRFLGKAWKSHYTVDGIPARADESGHQVIDGSIFLLFFGLSIWALTNWSKLVKKLLTPVSFAQIAVSNLFKILPPKALILAAIWKRDRVR